MSWWWIWSRFDQATTIGDGFGSFGMGGGWGGINRGNYWDTELVRDWNRPINNYIYYNNDDDKCSQLDSPFREQCNDCEDNFCNYSYDNSSNTGKCSC